MHICCATYTHVLPCVMLGHAERPSSNMCHKSLKNCGASCEPPINSHVHTIMHTAVLSRNGTSSVTHVADGMCTKITQAPYLDCACLSCLIPSCTYHGFQPRKAFVGLLIMSAVCADCLMRFSSSSFFLSNTSICSLMVRSTLSAATLPASITCSFISSARSHNCSMSTTFCSNVCTSARAPLSEAV